MQTSVPLAAAVALFVALLIALVLLYLIYKERQKLVDRYSDIISVDEEVIRLQGTAYEIKKDCEALNNKYKQALVTYKELEEAISLNRDSIELFDYGLYEPQFDFETSQEYKDKIQENYTKQKEAIKNDRAVVCTTQWTVNGKTSEGNRMTNKYKKLMMFAFNGECDRLISKVRWHNIVQTRQKVNKAFDSINKLGVVHSISIQKQYLDLKMEELNLTYEYERKKYEEKEEQRRIREEMREEERARMEYEKAKREADEEEKRYRKALEKAMKDLGIADQREVEQLNGKIAQLEEKLREAQEKRERAMSMAQQTRAGHIYVISNIGSFGEGVYKIGMTRRLEPMDRVRELGDASVPFRFDVHAIIFSEDAPQLEYNIHKAFAERRVNMTNYRREFFKVELSEIEEYIKTHYKEDVEFIAIPEAKEYRETLSVLEHYQDSESITEPELTFPEDLFDDDY